MAIRKCRGIYIPDHILFPSRLVDALLIGLAFLNLAKENTNKHTKLMNPGKKCQPASAKLCSRLVRKNYLGPETYAGNFMIPGNYFKGLTEDRLL